MRQDAYYPPALVDRVQAELEALVADLESGPRTLDEIQSRCDEMTEAINRLQESFEAAGSDIETVARDDIAVTVRTIFETYGVTLDLETALGKRDW